MAALYDDHDGRLRGRRAQARRLRLWTAEPHCAKCKRLTNYPSGFQLDHRVPLFKGGKDEDDNLQVLCIPCHDTKTNQDLSRVERAEFDADGRVKW
jgi:5-methylcytosine-specific restriction protein A